MFLPCPLILREVVWVAGLSAGLQLLRNVDGGWISYFLRNNAWILMIKKQAHLSG